MNDTLAGVYIEASEIDVSDEAVIIATHFVYKVINEEDGKRFRARLCQHDSKDNGKRNIRPDSCDKQFDFLRMMISISLVQDFLLACVDSKGVYLQSGPITRDLYIRPLKEGKGPWNILWKLTMLPYGICKAGRPLAITIEKWLLTKAHLNRVRGVSQL